MVRRHRKRREALAFKTAQQHSQRQGVAPVAVLHAVPHERLVFVDNGSDAVENLGDGFLSGRFNRV
jgi:hypothetical protein